MPELTRVVFRRWKANPKTVIALFPDLPSAPGFCLSFEHIGQHGGALYAGVIRRTIPAEPYKNPDVWRLQGELQAPPYNYHLEPIARYSKPR